MPQVVLEALAFGLPCIATDWAGLPDAIIEDVTGYLVPCTISEAGVAVSTCQALPDVDARGALEAKVQIDTRQLQRAMLMLATRPQRVRMGAAARQHILQNLTLSRVVSDRIEIMREVAARAQGPISASRISGVAELNLLHTLAGSQR